MELARTDPALLLQRHPGPVLIDEIQHAPGLLPYIKMAVDRDGQPGRFWLTGSQQVHLMRDVADSLAGRVGIVHLPGLSRREQGGQADGHGPFMPAPADLVARLEDAAPLRLPELYRASGAVPTPR